MFRSRGIRGMRGVPLLMLALMLVISACAPASSPAPTAAPAKPAAQPAATTAPAKPAESKPAATTAPAAAKPTEKPAAAAQQGPPIKFGGNVALTGPSAVFGQQFLDAYTFYKESINEKGGIKVGNTMHPVELVYYDDRTDPTTGAKLVEKLIEEDKVDFIWGSASSALNFAATVITEKYERPIVIGGGGAADNIYDRGFKYVFTMMASAEEYIHPVLDAAALLDPKPQTVAILTRNDLFPLQAAEGAKKRAEQLGMRVVYFERFPVDVQDLTTPLTQVKDANADIFILSAYSGEQILAMKQMKELRLAPKIVGMPNGPIAKDWIPSLGNDGNFVVYPVQWTPQMTWKDPVFGGAKELAQKYQARYGRVPEYFEVQAIAALEILQLGIEKCACLDPKKVRDAIAELDTELASGPLKFGPNGRNTKTAQAALQLQENDNRVVIFPKEAMTGQLIFPFPEWGTRR